VKRQDVTNAVTIVLAGAIFLGLGWYYQMRTSPWVVQLLFFAALSVVLFLLWLEQKRDPGRYANYPKSPEMGAILGQAWGRRRRGAANPHRVSSEDATPITPRSMLAPEKQCPTCQAPQLSAGFICRHCGALVNPAWVIVLFSAVLLFFGAWMWRSAHP
jgi:hypothetical protein